MPVTVRDVFILSKICLQFKLRDRCLSFGFLLDHKQAEDIISDSLSGIMLLRWTGWLSTSEQTRIPSPPSDISPLSTINQGKQNSSLIG
jgi:hypothetical protein